MTKLEEKIGSIEGAWALHYGHVTNQIVMMLYFHKNGTIKGDWTNRSCYWAINGDRLIILRKDFTVNFLMFVYGDSTKSVVLREMDTQKDRGPWAIQKCGKEQSVTTYITKHPYRYGDDVLPLIKSGKDFSYEIKPAEDVEIYPVPELTGNFTDAPMRVTDPRTYLAQASSFHVINNAKIISGLIVETADGKCLKESIFTPDLLTGHLPVKAYIDYKTGRTFYDDVEATHKLDGICFYIDNDAAYGHLYAQSMAAFYVLNWLGDQGVDLKKVKILFRNGLTNPDFVPALKAYGLYEKLGPDAIVNLAELLPAVRCEQLIWPHSMFMPADDYIPELDDPNKFISFPIPRTYKSVIDTIKSNLSKSASPAESPRYIFNIRKANIGGRSNRLLNQQEILDALEPLGFVGVDPGSLNFEEKVRTYRNAKIVVSCQGSGTYSSSFAAKDSYIVELFQNEYEGTFITMSVIAAVMDIHFSCLVFPRTHLDDDWKYPAHFRCFRADVDKIVATVKKIIPQVEAGDTVLSKSA